MIAEKKFRRLNSPELLASLRRTTIRRWDASAGNLPEAPRRLITFTHLFR
jgi:hypothetical protein